MRATIRSRRLDPGPVVVEDRHGPPATADLLTPEAGLNRLILDFLADDQARILFDGLVSGS